MEKGNFRPLQNRHPSTDHRKNVTGDYVRKSYSYAKLGAYRTAAILEKSKNRHILETV